MRELVFQVEFKSDIVLPSTSNSEGKVGNLDFIAGSAFLGMVASKYSEFDDSFDIFHSGKVRFGDAHILIDEQESYKMPLSIFRDKNDESRIANQITSDINKLKQAKQVRNGYMTKSGVLRHLEYNYSQKSAYDRKHRRSKDSQMYGYSALKAGSKWQFVVRVDRSIDQKSIDLIINTLKQSKRLGKSRSAEYGRVEIIYLADKARDAISIESKTKEIVLYCNSRLALIDEQGNASYDSLYICSGLDSSNIVFEKTQIRTASYAPYNRARETNDSERLCIEKGSVIVLKDLNASQLDEIKNGVGMYLSEGFGEIIINPSFLLTEKLDFRPLKNSNDRKIKVGKIITTSTNNLVQFLANRHNDEIDMLDIANDVASFIEKNKSIYKNKVKPSQWGNIRSIASSSNEFIEDIKSYITHGDKKWQNDQVKILIRSIEAQEVDPRSYTTLLAMKMGAEQ